MAGEIERGRTRQRKRRDRLDAGEKRDGEGAGMCEESGEGIEAGGEGKERQSWCLEGRRVAGY